MFINNFKTQLVFSFIILSISCSAQTSGSQLDIKMTDMDQFRNSRERYNYEVSYLIDGQTVLGTPFFFDNWSVGTIKTVDNRFFDNYKLKYNVYNQKILFRNDYDSLEADNDIAEFTLINGQESFHFINSKALTKQKPQGFYQIIIDDSAGKVLSYNTKKVSDESFGIPAFRGKKHFEPEKVYFSYNSLTKKTDRINLNGSNINSILAINIQVTEQLKLSSYNLREETELVKFFQTYYSYVREH